MTDQHTTEQQPDPTDAAQPDTEQPDVAKDEQRDDKPTREAAKYRRQLRDVEAETEQLRAELTTARIDKLHTELANYRIQIDSDAPNGTRHETHYTFDPRAIADSGLADEVFDGATINPERLEKAMRTLLETKPYMFGNHQDRYTLSSTESAKIDQIIKDATKPAEQFTKAFGPSTD